MADRIRKIQESFKKGSNNGDELSAAISYVPLVGWLFTIHRDDDFTHFHAVQARDINIGIVVIYLAVWLLENFPLTRWLFGDGHFLHPVIEAFWVISLLAYLGLSAYAAYQAIMDERWQIPFLDDIKDQIEKRFRK